MPRYSGCFLELASVLEFRCRVAQLGRFQGALNRQQHPLCRAALYARREPSWKKRNRALHSGMWLTSEQRGKHHACQLSFLCVSSVVAGAIWWVFPFAPSAAQSVCCQQLMKSLARCCPLGKSRAMNRPATCISACSALRAAFAVPPSLMIVPLPNNGLSLWSYCSSQCQRRCFCFWQSCGVQWVLLCCPQWQAQVLRHHTLTKNVQVNE